MARRKERDQRGGERDDADAPLGRGPAGHVVAPIAAAPRVRWRACDAATYAAACGDEAEWADGEWHDISSCILAYDLAAQMATPLTAPLDEPVTCLESEVLGPRSAHYAVGGRLSYADVWSWSLLREGAQADAATFSWGSFSWWVARLTRGSVLYDRGLRNSTWLEASGCGALVFGGGGAFMLNRRARPCLMMPF